MNFLLVERYARLPYYGKLKVLLEVAEIDTSGLVAVLGLHDTRQAQSFLESGHICSSCALRYFQRAEVLLWLLTFVLRWSNWDLEYMQGLMKPDAFWLSTGDPPPWKGIGLSQYLISGGLESATLWVQSQRNN
jgi:hypothetical protein